MMLNLNTRTAVSILACASLIGLSGCATVQTHPDFAARQKDIHTIQLVPPDIDAYEITFNAGNQPLPMAIDAIQGASYDQTQQLIESKGYNFVAVSPSDVSANPALKSALFEMQSLYKKALEDIAHGKQKQFTYTVGSSPNAFADFKAAEAVILIKATAWKKSKGETAANVMEAIGVGVATLGMYTPQVTFHDAGMQIAVVDANLGDILWYNYRDVPNAYDPANKNDMMRLVKDTFGSFPNDSRGSAPVSAKKKEDRKSVPASSGGQQQFAQGTTTSPVPASNPVTSSNFAKAR